MLLLINQVYGFCFGLDFLILLLGLLISWRAPANGRRHALRALLITALFSIVDYLLLNGLIWLKQ